MDVSDISFDHVQCLYVAAGVGDVSATLAPLNPILNDGYVAQLETVITDEDGDTGTIRVRFTREELESVLDSSRDLATSQQPQNTVYFDDDESVTCAQNEYKQENVDDADVDVADRFCRLLDTLYGMTLVENDPAGLCVHRCVKEIYFAISRDLPA